LNINNKYIFSFKFEINLEEQLNSNQMSTQSTQDSINNKSAIIGENQTQENNSTPMHRPIFNVDSTPSLELESTSMGSGPPSLLLSEQSSRRQSCDSLSSASLAAPAATTIATTAVASLSAATLTAHTTRSSSPSFSTSNLLIHQQQQQQQQQQHQRQPTTPHSNVPLMRTLSGVNESMLLVQKQLHAAMLRQLLALRNLNAAWFDVLMPLVCKCVDLVRPDVKHDNDNMDIRSYVKLKKLPVQAAKDSSYLPSSDDCRIVNGLVFSKNIAHKQMRAEMKHPKILLLRSSIEYQRSGEDKMCSLEPIMTAESQYLKNTCSKLLLRQNPDILIVEKSVARYSQ
jgi:hypothetical protein